ncbi:MAG TPA: UGSC family (seleno)protein [Streptosporangiaceae bacterium]
MFDSIIDPTKGPAASAQAGGPTLAARPASLAGLRVGLLLNTKRNAEPFVAEVGRLLADQFGVQVTVARQKPNIVETAPQEMFDDLRTGSDVVVTGVGDCGSCSASAVADALKFEAAGIPAAAIVSDAFIVTADAMASLRGAVGYRYATTPHPVANLTEDGVQARAAQVVPAIVELLLAPALAVSA